jgi:excisionase family DNA binding protein
MSDRTHPKMQNRLPEDMRYLNVLELASLLGISRLTVYDWVGQRRIPYFKAGRSLRFDRVQIDKWIKSTSYVPRLKDVFLGRARPRKAKPKPPHTEPLSRPRTKPAREGLPRRRIARLVPEGFRVVHRRRKRRSSRGA